MVKVVEKMAPLLPTPINMHFLRICLDTLYEHNYISVLVCQVRLVSLHREFICEELSNVDCIMC